MRKEGSDKPRWLKSAMAFVLSASLALQGMPVQAIGEELGTNNDATPTGQLLQSNDENNTNNTVNEPVDNQQGNDTDTKTDDQNATGQQGTDAGTKSGEQGTSGQQGTDAGTKNGEQNATGQQAGDAGTKAGEQGAAGQAAGQQPNEGEKGADAGTTDATKDKDGNAQTTPATNGEEKKDEEKSDEKKSEEKKDEEKSDDEKSDEKKDEEKKDEEKKSDEKKDEEENASPAIDTTIVSSNALAVEIHAPEGAFPAGTDVVVTAVDASALINVSSNLVEGEPVDARAVDISFVHEGSEVEPAAGTSVSVSLYPFLPVEGTDFTAVHLRDNGAAEVVDNGATSYGASFEATDFSVYGIVGGSVVRGPDEQYKRIKLVFRNGYYNGSDAGAIVSTQIVHAGDTIDEPDPSSNVETQIRPGEWDTVVPYPALRSWKANGVEVDRNAYFGTTLTEQDIDAFIAAYKATPSADGTNLYEVDVIANYGEGYRAYIHQAERTSADAYTIYDCIVTDANQQVNLGEAADIFVPREEGTALIGWTNRTGDKTYKTDEVVTLTDDTDFFPILAKSIPVVLDMGGAPSVEDVAAVWNETSKKFEVELSKLPTDVVTQKNFYPGWTFDGWYQDAAFTTQITESAPAQFAEVTETGTIYAKWTANEQITYTVAYLAEDASGEPGQGNFYPYATVTGQGKAGDVIPLDQYSGMEIPYHHIATEDEAHYADNQQETTINGAGNTVKLVYYYANRIQLTCTPTFGTKSGAQILPSKYVKPGESLDVWLSDAADKATFDEYVFMGDPDKGDTKKRYVEDRSVGYSFTGRETIIPYVEQAKNASADKSVVPLKATEDVVLSNVMVNYYYEAIDGEQEGDVTLTLDGQTHTFVLDHATRWGSAGNYDQAPNELFGYVYDDGGLTEWAYKGKLSGEGAGGTVKAIPADHVGNPQNIKDNYRYDKYYYDHYFVRSKQTLSFSNLEGMKAETPASQTLMFGATIAKHLPNITSQTQRVFGDVTYHFVGWYTNQVAADNPISPESEAFKLADDATMPAGDLVLYAGWAPLEYTVTFDAQGGLVNGQDTLEVTGVRSGSRVLSPDEVTRAKEGDTEYDFGGWYKDAEFTKRWNFNTDTVHDDITLYARWVASKYVTITYYNADGTKKLSWDDKFLAGTRVKLDATAEEVYEGKPFLGWSLKKGDVNWLVPNTFYIVDNMDLYAVYGDAPLKGAPTLTLHANYPQADQGNVAAEAENDATATIVVTPDTPNGEVTLPEYDAIGFERPYGYKFIGWADNSEASGMVYAASKQVGVGGEPGENTDLYAVWESRGYKEMNATLNPNVYDYTGSAITPKPVVTNENGDVLTEGTDYTLEYTNNVEVTTDDKKAIVTVVPVPNSDYEDCAPIDLPFDIRAKAQPQPKQDTKPRTRWVNRRVIPRTSDSTSWALVCGVFVVGLVVVAMGALKRRRNE